MVNNYGTPKLLCVLLQLSENGVDLNTPIAKKKNFLNFQHYCTVKYKQINQEKMVETVVGRLRNLFGCLEHSVRSKRSVASLHRHNIEVQRWHVDVS